MQTFQARYPGKCGNCLETIQVGQYIGWNRRGIRKIFHVDCQNPNAVPESAQTNHEPSLEIEQSITPSNGHNHPETSTMPIPTAKTATASNGGQDAIIALAMAIRPLIENDLAGKVDETRVKEIVSQELAQLEQPTQTIVINKRTEETKELVGLQHKLFPKLLSLVAADSNVYLYGASGGGKDFAAKQVSEALGLPFYMMSLNKQTTPSMVIGYGDANGKFVETTFFQWYTQGGIFHFAEYDNASGNLQTSLNTALENGHAHFPVVGLVQRHKDARLIASGNTVGLGANATYNSREVMDGASRERFEFLAWEYDTKLETTVAKQENPKHGEIWTIWIQVVRAYVKSISSRLVVSPRASIKGAKLLTLGTFTPEEVADLVLFKGIDSDTRHKILTANPLPSLRGVN